MHDTVGKVMAQPGEDPASLPVKAKSAKKRTAAE
jgi:hypothetical protein